MYRSCKRLHDEDSFNISKKRKFTHNTIAKIIKYNSDTFTFLVEWTDQTRSWEPFDNIKHLETFKQYINKVEIDKKQAKQDIPTYIS